MFEVGISSGSSDTEMWHLVSTDTNWEFPQLGVPSSRTAIGFTLAQLRGRVEQGVLLLHRVLRCAALTSNAVPTTCVRHKIPQQK